MPESPEAVPGEVTRLLHEARGGAQEALDRVLALIYDDLRVIARRQLQREYAERTLEPTALVHEAYLKLVGSAALGAADRAHFLAIAAHAMRQVLVDHARRRTSAKRGDAAKMVTLSDAGSNDALDADELLALDDALERLEPRQRQIVECRFFAGMDDLEIAAALGVTDRTVRREWVKARAWLNKAIYGGQP
jgi:RNA polymerase sigma factor (TIGR02999 family)